MSALSQSDFLIIQGVIEELEKPDCATHAAETLAKVLYCLKQTSLGQGMMMHRAMERATSEGKSERHVSVASGSIVVATATGARHAEIGVFNPFTKSSVLIDKGIAGLIELLWKCNIETDFSCEGSFDNDLQTTAYISFTNVQSLEAFLRTIERAQLSELILSAWGGRQSDIDALCARLKTPFEVEVRQKLYGEEDRLGANATCFPKLGATVRFAPQSIAPLTRAFAAVLN